MEANTDSLEEDTWSVETNEQTKLLAHNNSSLNCKSFNNNLVNQRHNMTQLLHPLLLYTSYLNNPMLTL